VRDGTSYDEAVLRSFAFGLVPLAIFGAIFGAFLACGDDNGADDRIAGDGELPKDANGGSDGPPSPANDASGDTTSATRFCQGRAALVCEDFESSAFPPTGWLTEGPGAGKLEVGAGYASARGLVASHGAAANDLDAFLYRDDVTLEAKHKTVRISARVRVTAFTDPESPMTVLTLRVSPASGGKLISFVVNSATSASLVADDAGGNQPGQIDSAFSIGTWHAITIELTRAPSYAMALRYDDKLVGAALPITSITDGAKRVAMGVRSSGGAGARNVEIDDVLVEGLP